MATFVLVHGSFHGGWCWRKVAPALREAGLDYHEIDTGHDAMVTAPGELTDILLAVAEERRSKRG